jgi:hypothetical protein
MAATPADIATATGLSIEQLSDLRTLFEASN